MIDFKSNSVFKLKPADLSDGEKLVGDILIDGEFVKAAYHALRDYVVFTNRRVIAVNVQKLTGKKKDFTSLPYSKISVFSVETAGVLDVDAEMDLWYSGLGHVRFQFTGHSDLLELNRIIASYALL